MKRSVVLEAIAVGLFNLLMFVSIRALIPNAHVFMHIILAGITFHLFFEYSPFGNINKMWCDSTFPKSSSKS